MKDQFKQKYFTNNFYWVNKENYATLQKIAIEVGCLCHTGKSEIIEWHEGFKNLGFRTYEKNGNVTVFQKEPFLLHGHVATDYDSMIADYKTLMADLTGAYRINKKHPQGYTVPELDALLNSIEGLNHHVYGRKIDERGCIVIDGEVVVLNANVERALRFAAPDFKLVD